LPISISGFEKGANKMGADFYNIYDNKDKRRHVRLETGNLISYESISSKGQIVSRGMGKALNISRSGILLEASKFVKSDYVSLTTVDFDNNLIQIKGRPIYCTRTDSGMYQVGISFIGSEQETDSFSAKLIKLYHYRKHNSIMKVAG